MKRVEAYVRPDRLEVVQAALEAAGVRGMTCEPVRGYGRQLGQTATFQGSHYALNLVPKVRIDAVVPDALAEAAVEAIAGAVRTGELGDGKIFVSEVLEAVRIRTGERGDSAVS
jgi:nitrogen regulatory protein P-II 1